MKQTVYIVQRCDTGGHTVYFACVGGTFSWCTDVTRSMMFARNCDAQAILDLLGKWVFEITSLDPEIVEHTWVS